MNVIKDVCEKVKTTGRHTVMYSDFAEYTDLDITKIRRHCTLDNTTLNDVVKLYGCELQRSGNGMNHRFEDGEFTVSKYEYDFSQFLRENGFEYNKTYFVLCLDINKAPTKDFHSPPMVPFIITCKLILERV